jgi:tryptophan-rich sensory protein
MTTPDMTRQSLAALAVAVLLPLGVGALGALATSGSVRTWYPTLVRPSFAPPSWVFGPTWTALYVMMGVASWLVWREGFARPDVRSALALYGVQLVFNLAWSWLFFGLRQPLTALVDIVVLLALVALTLARFASVSRAAAGLMLPYLAWVAFATALNGAFWWLNRNSA